MAKPDGGAAFPHTYVNGEYVTDGGMTLRDYFAAAALQGGLSNPNTENYNFAKMSYLIADAMLAERGKEPG